MRSKAGSAERGQILVIVAAGLVVLLAISALAIDVGFSWMLRRQEQNAADPAAIAAARHLRNSSGDPSWAQEAAEDDACFYAHQNGFFKDDVDCGIALANDDLQVWSPPISGPHSGQQGHVQVIIQGSHPAFFGRILGADEIDVTTSATAANTSGNSNSSSLVALQDECSGGATGQVSGGGTVRIFPAAGVPAGTGGSVHVNSPCGNSTDNVCNNGSGPSDLHISGRLETTFASVVGSCAVQGSDADDGLVCTDTSPCLKEAAIPLGDPLAWMPEPSLTGFPDAECPDGTPSTPLSTTACELKKSASACPDDGFGVGVCTLEPGVYYGGLNVKSNVKVFLEPGMYILAGGGIKLSGDSSIEAVDDGAGQPSRVTIFSTDGPGCSTGIGVQCQDSITFTANQAFRVRATPGSDALKFDPTCRDIMPGYNLCQWAGLLLWQDGTASNPTAAVKLGGQTTTVLSGTIYAPKADVTINGGSGTTGCSGTSTASCLAIQVVSATWKIDGNALIEMPYNPDEIVKPNQRGLVY
jgi:hypothetical protein